MDSKQDAYGQNMAAHFRNEKTFELVERIDGYIDLSGGSNSYFQEFPDWPAIQKKAIQYAQGKVLDIGAGAGRVALYLQEKGIEVLATDNSPLAIEVCKKRGVQKTQIIAFQDITQLAPEKFDTIIMFGNNFGLFESYETAKVRLKELHSITNPEALILAESNDPYQTDNPAHVAYQEANRKQGRLPGQLRIRIRFKEYMGEWFDYLLASETEMRSILKGTGWRIKETVKDNNSPYVAIFEKGEET